MPNYNYNDCAKLTELRRECQERNGIHGEDCMVLELREKRCVAHTLCPNEAAHYYGVSQNPSEKALCSSWAESFVFGISTAETVESNIYDEQNNILDSQQQNRAEMVTELEAQRHRNASDYVRDRPNVKSECKDMVYHLSKCLQKNRFGKNQ